MPFIQNISRSDCMSGNHLPVTERDVLIQISCPPADPPAPLCRFGQVHQFWFDDIEEEEGRHCEQGITTEQAAQIASILTSALSEGRNIIVHCNRGVSRSGAVALVGESIGFTCGSVTDFNNRVAQLVSNAIQEAA